MFNVKILKSNGLLNSNLCRELLSQDIHLDIVKKFDEEKRKKRIDAFIIEDNESKESIFEELMMIRKISNSLIILITSISSPAIRIAYFKLGVDIIFSKSTDTEELAVQLNKLLNRVTAIKSNNAEKERESICCLIKENRTFKSEKGEEISLTRLEYKLMELFTKNENRALSYEQISKYIWDVISPQKFYRVNNLVFHLREKIEEDSKHPQLIKTVRSNGYIFAKENFIEVSVDEIST
ncbi:two-component system response regulator VicR [Enterococcus rotai]|uniref:OmpR/PhoB-type domain-containing protein n=1 Tax=Enterococcus rotai TaxID=118060 RepID=A0A0U2X642_9ENTE|nr:winged helix-turn-helix domain-containing protein [Enterococcus rotai]ALS35600.1 hypothetical protein ATZ35_00015 [Enterococcus rotai]